ncbi:prenyltransferase/squalene oxidase repeat-containing protein [Halorussus caseinilyticus]|uniref:Prenyltransferase/squalene oxidase repeat-containing protein n=1 Tax=Halorussus caseinilyticus TaxID=3034025 RepID=A0ABD5WFG0_9EURY|nr:prenyltransferase/squalene oxidase repeat-containing protein [Halorussus sp. DT72]
MTCASNLLVAALVVTSVLAGATGIGVGSGDHDPDPSAAFATDGSENATRADAGTNVSSSRVRAGIDDSRGYLLNQVSDGRWFANLSYRNETGPRSVRITLNYALMLELVNGSDQSQRKALSYALDRRRADGGWNDTTANYAALLLLRQAYPGEYGDVVADIEREIETRNMSLEPFEGETFLNASFLTRVYYLELSDRYNRSELFVTESISGGAEEIADMTPAFEDGFDPDERFIVTYSVLGSMTTSIFVAEINDNRTEAARDRRELAAQIILGRQGHDGNWEVTQGGVRALTALALQNFTAENRSVRKGIDALERMQRDDGRLPPFAMSITDTADAHRTLHRTGVPKDNETLRRAAQWLLDARTTGPNGSNPAPAIMFRKYHGAGWALIPSTYSDWDDTALAIDALNVYDDRLTNRSVQFLFTVQNDDGSWGTYMTNFSPLNESERERAIDELGRDAYKGLFVDPEAHAVTAHALTAVGENGYTVENNESVRRAVEYLLENNQRNGLWDAAWYNEYTYGTAAVLLAFEDVGVDMDRPEVQRAAQTLIDKQNPDGGWGERWDPDESDYHRWGRSTVEQTAWAVQALLAAGVSPDHPAVRRGVDYLLDHQNADGSWAVHPSFRLGAGVPTYRNPVLTQTGGLMALTMYAESKDIPTAPEREEPGTVDKATEPETLVPIVSLATLLVGLFVRRWRK